MDERLNLDEILVKYHIVDYFSDLDELRSGMRVVRLPKHTLLYSRPEHKKYGYFLLEGKFQVHATAENGNQMLVRSCEDFIFIGDMELLGYNEPANITETVSDCLFLAIDISMYRERLLEDKKFLRFLCDTLAEKICYFAGTQFRNQTNSPRQKLAIHILNHGGEGYFKENLRKTGEFLQISYRHLHRLLGEFVENGILVRQNGGYIVVDRNRLQRAAVGEEDN